MFPRLTRSKAEWALSQCSWPSLHPLSEPDVRGLLLSLTQASKRTWRWWCELSPSISPLLTLKLSHILPPLCALYGLMRGNNNLRRHRLVLIWRQLINQKPELSSYILEHQPVDIPFPLFMDLYRNNHEAYTLFKASVNANQTTTKFVTIYESKMRIRAAQRLMTIDRVFLQATDSNNFTVGNLMMEFYKNNRDQLYIS